MLGKNLEPQETIDEYNSWCIVWEPPGEQPAPWNDAKNSVPRELEEVPPPVAWGGVTYWHISNLHLNTATLSNISCRSSKKPGVLDAGLWHRRRFMPIPNSSSILYSWQGHHEHPSSMCKENTQSKPNAVTHLLIFLFQLFAFSLNIYGTNLCSWCLQHRLHAARIPHRNFQKKETKTILLRDEYTDGNVTRESKKMIPITFKRTGAFTGRLAESWTGSPSCCTFLGWLGSVTSQIRRSPQWLWTHLSSSQFK